MGPWNPRGNVECKSGVIDRSSCEVMSRKSIRSLHPFQIVKEPLKSYFETAFEIAFQVTFEAWQRVAVFPLSEATDRRIASLKPSPTTEPKLPSKIPNSRRTALPIAAQNPRSQRTTKSSLPVLHYAQKSCQFPAPLLRCCWCIPDHSELTFFRFCSKLRSLYDSLAKI